MPQFRYTATNAEGKTVRGMADAPSEEALYTKLRDDGLYMSEALQTKRVRSAFRPLKTAVLAEGTEAVPPAGYDLVDIALMADVKNHTVARCVVHAVQRDGQLHGAEI